MDLVNSIDGVVQKSPKLIPLQENVANYEANAMSQEATN